MLLDNYHLVALSDNAAYKVTKFGGLKSTALGGEGLVTEITGPGIVYFQTKNLKELIDLLGNVTGPKTTGSPVTDAAATAFGLARRICFWLFEIAGRYCS